MVVPARRRSPRSSEEIEQLIRHVARDLFARKGYQGTTTMDIGKAAGVSERLIFSKFGSKSDLFAAVMVAPFADAVDEYADAWADVSSRPSTDEQVEQLIRQLYVLARENRKTLLDALGDQTSSPVRQTLIDKLASAFQRLLRISGQERFESVDWPAAMGTVMGMVLGAAMLDDLIYPSDVTRPTEDRLVEEMRLTLLNGYRGRLDI